MKIFKKRFWLFMCLFCVKSSVPHRYKYISRAKDQKSCLRRSLFGKMKKELPLAQSTLNGGCCFYLSFTKKSWITFENRQRASLSSEVKSKNGRFKQFTLRERLALPHLPLFQGCCTRRRRVPCNPETEATLPVLK